MRPALFWDVTQLWVVIVYRRLGQRIGPIFMGQEVTSVPTFRDNLSVLSSRIKKLLLCRRFWTTYRSCLHGSRSYFCTDVSGQPIGPVFTGKKVTSVPTFRDTYRSCLHGSRSYFCTDVSGQPIGPVFTGKKVTSVPTFRDNLSVLSSRVKKLLLYHLTLRNIFNLFEVFRDFHYSGGIPLLPHTSLWHDV
jgi:hypothetical protein